MDLKLTFKVFFCFNTKPECLNIKRNNSRQDIYDTLQEDKSIKNPSHFSNMQKSLLTSEDILPLSAASLLLL